MRHPWLWATVCALLISGPAVAQDRLVPGHMPAQVGSVIGIVSVDPTTGAPIAPTAGTAGTPSASVGSVQGVAGGTPLPVSAAFWQTTQPVSIASLPALAAGSALIGKAGIDQTTPGTTNNVTTDGVVDAAVRTDSVSSATTGASFGTAGYGSLTFQFIANAGGNTVVFEGSNDGGTTWGSVTVRRLDQTGSSSATGSSTNTTAGLAYTPQVVMPLMRWRVSNYISGTTTLAVGMKRDSFVNVVDANIGAGTVTANEKPTTTGGLTPFKIATGASGAGKSGAAQLYAYDFLNATASVRYMQFYNKTSAGIPGTDTAIYTVPLAANGRSFLSPPSGVTIGSTGCSWAITTDAAGATIASSGDVVGSFATN